MKLRLCLMMFVQYIVWGAWYVTISTYLITKLHFTGTQAGAVFSTASVAAIVSPFFVGLVADRFFAAERVMATLYGLSAIWMFLMTRATTFSEVYPLMLAFCLCYFPTVSLTNSITMQLVKDPGQDFPIIRVMGTLSWIFISNVIGYMKWETTTDQFTVTSIAALVMMLISLFLIPHTPPKAKGQKIDFRTVAGLDALVMLKDRSFLVFTIASILACIPITFYFSFTNDYLNERGVTNVAGKMSLGQASEVIMMLLMPLIFRFITVRSVIILGLCCWTVRYLALAYGDPGSGMWLFYLAILLHGASYDFFFMTGQLYTDQAAPPHLRNTAQGFITVCTYGVGMLAGSLLSGAAVDYYSYNKGGTVVHEWFPFWRSSSMLAFVFVIMVVLFFRTRTKIQPRDR